MINLTGDGQKNTQDTNSKYLNACNVHCTRGCCFMLKLNLESVIDN